MGEAMELIKDKRELMKICNTLIPVMDSEEMAKVALVLSKTIDRLIKEKGASNDN